MFPASAGSASTKQQQDHFVSSTFAIPKPTAYSTQPAVCLHASFCVDQSLANEILALYVTCNCNYTSTGSEKDYHVFHLFLFLNVIFNFCCIFILNQNAHCIIDTLECLHLINYVNNTCCFFSFSFRLFCMHVGKYSLMYQVCI